MMNVPEIGTDCAYEPDVFAFKIQQTNQRFHNYRVN